MMLRPNPWKPDYVGAYTGSLDPIDALRDGANDRWEQVLFLLSEIGRDAADPDVSAGLIEAATLERYARSIAMWCYRENVTDFERLSYIVNHPVTRRYAKRSRAADRSGE